MQTITQDNTVQDQTTQKFAVVTGASSGIGYELARQCIQNDFSVLIVAEDAGIHQAAQRLQQEGGSVQAVQADLATPEGVDTLYQAIQAAGRPVDAICINAGVGVGGPFIETSWEKELNMINLNVISTVYLTKLILKDLVAQGAGRILFTGSIAGTTPGPFEAVYAATKAFVMSFSDAIRNEVQDTGVTVTALQPGATNTNFFHRAGLDDTQVGSEGKYDNAPEDVARQGFQAMMDGDAHIIAAGLKTKMMGIANELLPEGVKATQHRKMSEPGSAKKSA